jgi:hypothetical protein
MTVPYDELVFQSPYLAVVKAKQLLEEGKMKEVDDILESLAESMGRSEKRAVINRLTRLILHIIKWKCQPEKRSASWVISIRSARAEITASQEEMPSLNRAHRIPSSQQDFSELAAKTATSPIALVP